MTNPMTPEEAQALIDHASEIPKFNRLRNALLDTMNAIIQDEGGMAGGAILAAVASVWLDLVIHGARVEEGTDREAWLDAAGIALTELKARVDRLRM